MSALKSSPRKKDLDSYTDDSETCEANAEVSSRALKELEKGVKDSLQHLQSFRLCPFLM